MNRAVKTLTTFARRGWLAILLFAIGAPRSSRAASDEVAAWQSLNLRYLHAGHLDLAFYGELRASLEPERFGGYLMSQRFQLDLHPNLAGSINYTFLSQPSKTSDVLMSQHRLEFELTPRFKAGDWLVVRAGPAPA